jgi:hypothetical protein
MDLILNLKFDLYGFPIGRGFMIDRAFFFIFIYKGNFIILYHNILNTIFICT